MKGAFLILFTTNFLHLRKTLAPVKATAVNAEVELYKLVKTFQTFRAYSASHLAAKQTKAFGFSLVFEIATSLIYLLRKSTAFQTSAMLIQHFRTKGEHIGRKANS